MALKQNKTKCILLFISMCLFCISFCNIYTYKTVNLLHDEIRITIPVFNQTLTSPFIIKGEAKGTWFFEGDFPIHLFTIDHHLITTAIASTEYDWMTESFIPFEATLSFDTPIDQNGYILIQNNNPSDNIQLNKMIRIPIRFK